MDRYRPALTRRWATALAVPPLAFLGLFFLWPVANILALGIAPEGQLNLGSVLQTWAQPFVLDTVLFTLALAGLSTFLTLLLGLPPAWVFARFTFPGKSLARALTVVPFVLPTVVVGSAFLALLGPRSPLNDLLTFLFGESFPQVRLDGSVAAILIANVFYNIAVIIRLVGGMWAHIDPRSEEAARMLGASPWRAFREVTWPLLRPAVISAASIVFLFTVTSFGVVLLLGGPRDTTLEVEIYRQTAILLDLPTAAALTILQMVGVIVLLLASARAQEGLAVQQRLRGSGETARPPRPGRERSVVSLVLAATAVYMVTPLVVLVERSLHRDETYGLAAYASLLEADPRMRLSAAPWHSVVDSLTFAAADHAHRRIPGAAGRGRRRLSPRLALARDGHVGDVAPGHVRGHRRLRLPRHARYAAARSAHLDPAHPHRSLAHRAALRDALGGPGHPLHRRSLAGGGGGAGSFAAPCLA